MTNLENLLNGLSDNEKFVLYKKLEFYNLQKIIEDIIVESEPYIEEQKLQLMSNNIANKYINEYHTKDFILKRHNIIQLLKKYY